MEIIDHLISLVFSRRNGAVGTGGGHQVTLVKTRRALRER